VCAEQITIIEKRRTRLAGCKYSPHPGGSLGMSIEFETT
jgi:hypothetical protein